MVLSLTTFVRNAFLCFSLCISIQLLCQTVCRAALTINFDFNLASNPYEPFGDTTLSAANQAVFTDAGNFWQSLITGYADNVSRTLTIYASAFSQPAAGGSILLGQAGPRLLSTFSAIGDTFVFARDGFARFNVNPAATFGGLLNAATIRHEVGHILGIGTLWDLNGVYTDGSGRYTGANALEAFRNEFSPAATFVPVELGGGAGTADSHWNEGNTPPLTVLQGPNVGLNLDNELMTGFLSGDNFLSDTTLGSLRDIGFTTVPYRAVPEPSGLALFGFVVLAGLRVRSRTVRIDFQDKLAA